MMVCYIHPSYLQVMEGPTAPYAAERRVAVAAVRKACLLTARLQATLPATSVLDKEVRFLPTTTAMYTSIPTRAEGGYLRLVTCTRLVR
jgi:hypothetical protein